MSTPPPRISLSELWGHARIRDLLSITVKCKILKLSTKKCQGCFQAAHLPPPPPPPPPKKKNPGSAYGRLTIHASIPCMDLLLIKNSLYHKNVQITPINIELAAFHKHGGPRISFFLIVLTKTNFDHYIRDSRFGILKKKTKHVVRPTAWRPLSGQLSCPPWGRTD